MAAVHYHQGAFPPTERLDWQRLAPSLSSASLALGRFANSLADVPNSSVLLSIMTRQEAEYSSRIEGTQATVEDVLRFEAGQEPESLHLREDIREVINYRDALQQARELLEHHSLSQDIILELHRTLLSGTRGQDKNPGAFRAIDNFIGKPGSTKHDASYVPGQLISRMYDALDTWLSYTLSDPSVPLLKVALMHAEFEAIHPFSDGNGRLGRILIPLMMWQYGLIPEPLDLTSVSTLRSLRDEYIERLQAVSRDDDWTGWCEFFFKVVETQASNDLAKMRSIRNLYDQMKHQITEVGRSKYGIHILDGIFNRPIFTTSSLVDETGIPVRAARRILERLTDSGILTEVRPGRGQNPSVFLFTELLRVVEDETKFE